MLRSAKTIRLLEVFLLAILNTRTEVTVYSLKRDFGLNPGGLMHAFRALNQKGLVTRVGAPGRSRAYRITPVGDETLRTQWKDVINDIYLDRDWAIRAVWLATAMNLPSAPTFLRSLARKMQQA